MRTCRLLIKGLVRSVITFPHLSNCKSEESLSLQTISVSTEILLCINNSLTTNFPITDKTSQLEEVGGKVPYNLS